MAIRLRMISTPGSYEREVVQLLILFCCLSQSMVGTMQFRTFICLRVVDKHNEIGRHVPFADEAIRFSSVRIEHRTVNSFKMSSRYVGLCVIGFSKTIASYVNLYISTVVNSFSWYTTIRNWNNFERLGMIIGVTKQIFAISLGESSLNMRFAIFFALCVATLTVFRTYFDGMHSKAKVQTKAVSFLEAAPAKDAWYDVRFAAAVEPQAPDKRILHLRNRYEDQPVGLDVLVQGKFRTALKLEGGSAKIDSDALRGLKVTLLRSGTESDQLLKVLDRLYGTGLQPKAMVQSFALEAIPLQGEDDGFAKVKLFGNSNGKQDEYFELFLNVNFTEGWAELAEKDPAYRVPIIRTLAANSRTR